MGLVATILLAALFMSACGGGRPAQDTAGQPQGSGGGGQPSQASGAEKVTMGAVDNVLSSLFMVGVSKGFFLKHGMDVELKLFKSGQEVAKALASGDIQFGTSAMNNFQTELQAGIRNVAFMSIMGDNASLTADTPLAIVAAPGSGITKPADLKGKTIGLSLGGTAELYLRQVLKKAGLHAEDVKMVQVPPANSVTAIKTKQVDALSLWEPWQTQVLREVPGSVEVVRGGGYLGYIIFGLTKEETFRQRPDLVKKVVMGFAETAAWVRQNPDEAGAVVASWISGLDPKIAGEAMRNVPFDIRITNFTKEVWDSSNQMLIEQGKLNAPVPMEGHFDTTVLREVVEEHPEWFSDLKSAELLDLKLP